MSSFQRKPADICAIFTLQYCSAGMPIATAPHMMVHWLGRSEQAFRSSILTVCCAAGGDYLRNTKALLLRANLQKHDFSQRSQAPRPSRASLLTQERLG